MAVTRTTNLSLVKPDYAEQADVDVLNDNFDAIDEAIGALQDVSVEVDDDTIKINAQGQLYVALPSLDGVGY